MIIAILAAGLVGFTGIKPIDDEVMRLSKKGGIVDYSTPLDMRDAECWTPLGGGHICMRKADDGIYIWKETCAQTEDGKAVNSGENNTIEITIDGKPKKWIPCKPENRK